MMNWIEHAAPVWQQWILWSLPGAVVLYLLVELIASNRRILSPRLRYWLFIGVLLKCIMPPIMWVSIPILSPEPMQLTIPDAKEVNETVATNPMPVMQGVEITEIKQQVPSIWQTLSLVECLLFVQLAGTGLILCFLLNKIGAHIRLRRALQSEDTGALCGRLCIRLNMRMPRLYVVPDGMGACAGGFFAPYIVIPQPVLHESREHQELIIMHELIHVQRMDHVVNWLQVAVFAVFWWHPIIWRMNYLIRCERELCCDERVVRELAIEPVQYSKLLVDAAERQILQHQYQWQTAFANPAHAFQNRIRRIITMNHITKTTRWLSAIMIVLLICGITVGFQFVQAQTKQEEINKALMQLERYKMMLEKLQMANREVPKVYLDAIAESTESFGEYFKTTFPNQEINEMGLSGMESEPKLSVLDKEIAGGIVAPGITVKQIIELMSVTTGLNYVLAEGVGEKKCTFNIGGNPTVKEVLDTVLPSVGLAYAVEEDGTILVDKKISILMRRPSPQLIPQFSKEVVETMISFKEVMKKIQQCNPVDDKKTVQDLFKQALVLIDSVSLNSLREMGIADEFELLRTEMKMMVEKAGEEPSKAKLMDTRSIVSRLAADFRSSGLALEMFFLDNNQYPPSTKENLLSHAGIKINERRYLRLTTPIAYVSHIAIDPFDSDGKSFRYISDGKHYILAANGPDKDMDIDLSKIDLANYDREELMKQLKELTYEPANGLKSGGDLVIFSKFETNSEQDKRLEIR